MNKKIIRLGLVVLLVGIMLTGYGGLCNKDTSSGSSGGGGSGSSGGSTSQLPLVRVWVSPLPKSGGGISVNVDDSGNMYVTGRFNAGVFLLKYNSAGTLEWQKSWNSGQCEPFGSAIDKTSGNIYVAGYSYGDGALLLKYKLDGTLLWQKAWKGGSSNRAHAVDIDNSGNIYICGYADADAFLLKYKSDGTLLWQKTWGGGTGSNYGYSVGVDKISNVIYLAGNTANFGAGGCDVFLLKYDTNGNLLWQKTWGGFPAGVGSPDDYTWGGIAIDLSGNIYVQGITYNFGVGERDVFVLKYNSSGTLLWQKTWGGNKAEWQGSTPSNYIAVDGVGNIYVTGCTESFDPGSDIFLLKYDTNGNLLQQKIWGGGSISGGYGYSIAVDASNIYLVGVGTRNAQWHDVSGTVTTPNGTETTPSGTEGSPLGNENTPAGTETILTGSETDNSGSLLLRIGK